jgi:hypothetical protein
MSPAEIAQDRRWRIKAWVLTTLAPDTIAAVLARSMPPTISELLTLARKRAEECAGKCPSCGEPLPVAGTQARPPKRKSKPLTATKGRRSERGLSGRTRTAKNNAITDGATRHERTAVPAASEPWWSRAPRARAGISRISAASRRSQVFGFWISPRLLRPGSPVSDGRKRPFHL